MLNVKTCTMDLLSYKEYQMFWIVSVQSEIYTDFFVAVQQFGAFDDSFSVEPETKNPIWTPKSCNIFGRATMMVNAINSLMHISFLNEQISAWCSCMFNYSCSVNLALTLKNSIMTLRLLIDWKTNTKAVRISNQMLKKKSVPVCFQRAKWICIQVILQREFKSHDRQ